nr:EAL domain-containing protein [Nannocystis sp.]
MNHRCDCQDVGCTRLEVAGLALFARARHVREQMARLIGGRAELLRAEGDVLLVRGELAPLLRLLSEQLTYTQRQDARAAPWDGERIDYTGTAALEQWAGRFESPWFSVAAQHLRFDLQPIAALDGGLVHGYEALVRGRLGEQEIGAGALLQAAGAHDQMAAFDARARSRAIIQAYPQVPAGARLFINFSPTVIYDPSICLNTTFRSCIDSGADITRLVFEVTEAHAFPDLTLLRKILDRYREEGARVALDDMGSGHTSLLYLSALRPDYVKLDRGLLTGLRHGDPRVPLLGAMIRYAHDLGILVIAEGIETVEELQIVRELGADLGQGYFLARPAAHAGELTQAARNALGGGVTTHHRRPDPARHASQSQRAPVEF